MKKLMIKIFNDSTFQVTLPYIMIVFGFFMYTTAVFSIDDGQWKKVFTDVGGLILSAGIFSVLLKSYQFLGIFKDELSKIVYDAAHLDQRKDLPEIWERVSRVLFKDNFPDISNFIMKDVKNIYFPTEQIAYCKDYKQTINIEWVDRGKDVVRVIQHSNYKLHSKDPSLKLNAGLFNKIIFKDRSQVSFKVDSFKVNGVDTKSYDLSDKVEENALTTTLKLELTGSEVYNIETRFVKQYCLKYDNIIGFNRDIMIHNLNVKIFTCKHLSYSFLKSGTLNTFMKADVIKEDYAEYDYKGMIYPKQGYLVIVRK